MTTTYCSDLETAPATAYETEAFDDEQVSNEQFESVSPFGARTQDTETDQLDVAVDELIKSDDKRHWLDMCISVFRDSSSTRSPALVGLTNARMMAAKAAARIISSCIEDRIDLCSSFLTSLGKGMSVPLLLRLIADPDFVGGQKDGAHPIGVATRRSELVYSCARAVFQSLISERSFGLPIVTVLTSGAKTSESDKVMVRAAAIEAASLMDVAPDVGKNLLNSVSENDAGILITLANDLREQYEVDECPLP